MGDSLSYRDNLVVYMIPTDIKEKKTLGTSLPVQLILVTISACPSKPTKPWYEERMALETHHLISYFLALRI